MNEQQGDVLDEVGRVLDALLRRAARGGIPGGPGGPDDRGRRPEATGAADPGGDVWAAATAEPPPEQPREEPRGHAHGDSAADSAVRAARHLQKAGESLLAALLEGVSAVDRARERPERDDRASGGDRDRKRPRQESPGRGAGTSERSGERRDRPERDAWAAATGGSGD